MCLWRNSAIWGVLAQAQYATEDDGSQYLLLLAELGPGLADVCHRPNGGTLLVKGILLKPDMIQAAAEGRKTNTRRAEAGLKEINREPDKWELIRRNGDGRFLFWLIAHDPEPDPEKRYCLVKPRYHVGETVYIKEAWRTEALYDLTPPSDIGSDALIEYRLSPDDILSRIMGRWRSPLHLPHWAARHFLTITDVRVERLQEITNEGIIAEGMRFARYKCNPGFPDAVVWEYHDGGTYCGDSGEPVFRRLWNSINPKYPWESNPWVFVYGFELLRNN